MLAACGGGSGGAGSPSSNTTIPPSDPPVEVGRALVRPAPLQTAGKSAGTVLAEVPLGSRLGDLASFARLAFQVQFYHPSDGVAETNWDEFLQYGMYAVASRPATEALATRLSALFATMAPALRLNPDASPATLPDGRALVAWYHRGYVDRLEPYDPEQAYENVRKLLDRNSLETATQGPTRSHARYQLGGIEVELPLVQVWRNERSVPASRGFEPPADIQLALHVTDPYLCLTVAAKAWGTLRHFFPYFPDLPQLDWEAELAPLLKACDVPAAERPESLYLALRRALTKLQDNHVGLTPMDLNRPTQGRLPLRFDRVEGRATVSLARADFTDVKVGDELLSINGISSSDWLAREMPLTQRNPHLGFAAALNAATLAPKDSLVSMQFRDAKGQVYERQLRADQGSDIALQGAQALLFTGKPLSYWLDADTLYVNLSDMLPEQRQTVEAEMDKARAWVLDLRRYPKDFDMIHTLARFAAGPIRALPMNMVQPYDPTQPPRRLPELQSAEASKKLKGPVIALCAAQSQSFNEHMLGFAQSAGIPLIGERTSGANGDMTSIRLSQNPAFNLSFTGLEVRRHDGSAFHARGLQPDIVMPRSVSSVRQGSDEVLMAAHAWVRERLPR